MGRNVILDANVLLYNPNAVEDFPDSNVLIPIEVIEQIDTFKRDMTELGRNSRTVCKLLDRARGRGKLGEGIKLDNGSLLRVICGEEYLTSVPETLETGKRIDRRILGTALALQQRYAHEDVVVVSKDVNLRVKADAFGVNAEDYEVRSTPEADQYTGQHQLTVPDETVRSLQNGETVTVSNMQFSPNEFVLLHSENDSDQKAPGRFDQQQQAIVPLINTSKGAVGIYPLNLEQSFALAALLNDDIKMVTLTGKAGTGKTLLAMAAGLQKVFAEDVFHRVLVFRPTLPVGRDIGYLPGDVEEKMRPWMQPVYDALELIREEDRRRRERVLPPDILECEEISIEPMTFIRGRSIPHQYIIIDEAQNLTPLEVKTAVTRVGNATKIIMTGDPHQIDNPYVEALSNGLTYLVGRFQSSALAAHVGLTRGERSILAETAANML